MGELTYRHTAHTEIDLESFVRTSSGECTAIVSVTMIDHFGLDKHDALLYQDAHGGFATWWLLQHTRGYVPFITRVKIKKQIKWQE